MPDSSVASDNGPTVKSRRPAESAFKQQRLPAWQPILTAGTVLPTFFVIGIAFIPVGIGLLYFSDEVKEHIVDYTFCDMKGGQTTCADYIKQNNMTDKKCYCEMQLNLTEDFKAEVYFYYGLSNYYQNHRRYVKSRDDNQLLGKLTLPLSSDCDPFSEAHDENGVKKPVAPCGAIANSLFNDSLSLYSQEQQVLVPVLRTGLAWNSDKQIKFRNPDTSGGSLKAAFANYTKPANWAKHVWELDLENPDNNGFQNEDLIVWMRTAALPTFRKLYRRVNHDKDGFRTGLNKGLYTVNIEYNYPVTDFDGTKSFIISTTSLLGGKNPFLGVAYVVVGTLCLLLGIILLIIHVRCSKKYYPTPTESFFLDIDTYHRKYDDEDFSLVTNQRRGGGKTVSLHKPDETLASTISLKSPKATPHTKSMFDPSTSKTAVRSNLENSEAQTKKESAGNKEPPVSLKSSAATLVDRTPSSPGKEPMLERAGAATDVLTPASGRVKADAATGAAVTPSQVQTEHKATQSNPFGLILEESKPIRAPSDVTVPNPKQATFGGIEESKPTRVPSDVTVPNPMQAPFGLIEESKPTRIPSDITVPNPKQAPFGLIEESKPTRAPSDVTVPKSKEAEVLQTDATVPKVITPAPETIKADSATSVDQPDQDKLKAAVTSSQVQTKHDQDTSKAAQSNTFGGIEESKRTRAPSNVTVSKSKQAEVLQTDATVPKAQSTAPDTAQEAVKDDQIKKQDQNATAPAQKSPETAPYEPPTSKELDETTVNKKEKKD